MSGLTRALFRAMMTTVRDLKRRPLRVRLPVEQSRMQWMIPGAPQGALTDPIIESTAAHIAELFPSIASVNEDGQHWPLDAEEITPSQLRSAIRAEFRRGPSLPSSVSSSSVSFESALAVFSRTRLLLARRVNPLLLIRRALQSTQSKCELQLL